MVDGAVNADDLCHQSPGQDPYASTNGSPGRIAAPMRTSSPTPVDPASGGPCQLPLALCTAEEQPKTTPGRSIALQAGICPLVVLKELALGPTGSCFPGNWERPALPQQDVAIHGTFIVEGTVPTAFGLERQAGAQCESIVHAFAGYKPAVAPLASTALPSPSPSVPKPELLAQVPLSVGAPSHSATGSPEAQLGPLKSATPPHHDFQQHVSHLLGIMDPSTNEREILPHGNVSCIVDSAPSVHAALPSGDPLAEHIIPIASHEPAAGAVDQEGQTPGALEESGPAAHKNRAEEGPEAQEGRAREARAALSGKTFSAGTHNCAPGIEHAGLDVRDRLPGGYCDTSDVPAKHVHGGPLNPVAMQTESEDSDSSLPSLSLADLLGEMNK
jgi:hypothetical protein